MALYAAGLRFYDAANLKIPDLISGRMQLNVARGKGHKQRQVPLSALREYWKKYRPTDYLFPGKSPDRPYAATSIQKAIKVSARKANLQRTVKPHVLPDSYATGLLEALASIS